MFFSLWLACAASVAPSAPSDDDAPAAIPAAAPGQEVAVLAGGCFWCLESDLDHVDGIVATTSGYAGGNIANPGYHLVGAGVTGHAEVVRVVFDPVKIPYDKLLDVFFHHVDPTDAGGQFCDRGSQYRTAVFAQNEAQLAVATQKKAEVEAKLGPIATELVMDPTFYAAENYHQDFWKTTPGRYQSYRLGCGRDARVAEVWK